MAINRALLIHDVVFRSTTGITRERKRTFDEYTLHKVRVVPNVSRKDSTAGELPADSAVLFVDDTYSWCEPVASESEAEDETEAEENGDTDDEDTGEDVSSDDTLTTSSSGSTPLVPIVGDEIVFANRVWQVASVTMVYGTGAKVHHWEMLLV